MLLADFCQFGPHSIVLQTTLARAFVASITRTYADCEIRAQVIYLHGFEIKGGPFSSLYKYPSRFNYLMDSIGLSNYLVYICGTGSYMNHEIRSCEILKSKTEFLLVLIWRQSYTKTEEIEEFCPRKHCSIYKFHFAIGSES